MRSFQIAGIIKPQLPGGLRELPSFRSENPHTGRYKHYTNAPCVFVAMRIIASKRETMFDVALVILMLALCGLAQTYVLGCDRLKGQRT